MTRLCDGSGEIDIPSRYVRHQPPEDCDPPGYWSEPCPGCGACECDVCEGTGRDPDNECSGDCSPCEGACEGLGTNNCPECKGTGRKGGT
jgi:hypothetical protein